MFRIVGASVVMSGGRERNAMIRSCGAEMRSPSTRVPTKRATNA